MTRRSFLTNLGLACAALGLPVAAQAKRLVLEPKSAFRRMRVQGPVICRENLRFASEQLIAAGNRTGKTIDPVAYLQWFKGFEYKPSSSA